MISRASIRQQITKPGLKRGGSLKKKPKLGTGKRFKQLTSKLKKKKGVTNPEALAAFIGREKYGPKKFAKLSAQGRKRRS